MIRLFTTTISKESKKLVRESLDTTFISAGKKAEEFEKLLKTYGLKRIVSVNSGTSALHLALAAAGVNYGDEVILPSQTFISSGLSIFYQNAKPVFVDINYMSGNIDHRNIEEKITNKTKVIMVVHWGGYPCDMDEILNIARKYNLIVIEDASHAFGAIYKNKPIGSISDYTCFSFQAIKMLTTGDGGAVCSLNDEDEKKLKKLRWFDIDRDEDIPDLRGERIYNAKQIGYKYHMNDIAACIGIGNLKEIHIKLLRHQRIAERYRNELKNIGGIKLFETSTHKTSSHWLFGFHVEERNNFIKKLKDNNITSSIVHIGIDKNEIFGCKDMSLINQRKFDETQIHIPIHSDLNDEEITHIINTIKDGW